MPDPLPADRIPAKNDPAARKRYLGFLQKSLSAVHKTAQWYVAPVGNGMHSALTQPDVIPLNGSNGSIYLRATQRFEYGDHPDYPGERKIVTAQYVYTLAEDAALANEILSWQWHPGHWPGPHVHMHGDRKLHVPTARVAFEQVLLFAMTDLGVVPDRLVAEATEILNESLRRFQAFKQW